jgi:hypothetical protein
MNPILLNRPVDAQTLEEALSELRQLNQPEPRPVSALTMLAAATFAAAAALTFAATVILAKPSVTVPISVERGVR